MTNFKTHYNFEVHIPDDEVNNMPSLTVPDQSMSVSEIMRRFANGLPIGGQQVELWEQDDVFEGVDPRRLDLSEHEDLQRSIKQELSDIQLRQEKKEQQKQYNAQKKKIEAEVKQVENDRLAEIARRGEA